jgi:PhzF family phenazine biosynthesis protein
MRMKIVDAFTEQPFRGNPAAVAVLDTAGFLPEEAMQRVAAEMNLSETAFVHPLPPGGEAQWALRWFTPATEVALCGHATLATAHVLATGHAVRGVMRFATRSGVLTAQAADAADGERAGRITLDFPTAPLTALPVTAEVAQALDTPVLAMHDTGPNVGDLLVELADERTVRALAPDLPAVARLSHRGVIVTAAADGSQPGYDYVSRFFGPAVGVPEDPVTGSAHTALAPLWSARLGSAELTGAQVSARGGRVHTTLRGERTLLGGHAVTVLDAELLVRP